MKEGASRCPFRIDARMAPSSPLSGVGGGCVVGGGECTATQTNNRSGGSITTTTTVSTTTANGGTCKHTEKAAVRIGYHCMNPILLLRRAVSYGF